MKSEFGWIEIKKTRYDYDVVIHTDGSITRRSKKKSKDLKNTFGHTPLSEYELEFLESEQPEKVYIGTGQYGDLPLTPGAEIVLSQFETIIKPTPEILDVLENERRPYIAVIHVTC
jgi:hypothetical protein